MKAIFRTLLVLLVVSTGFAWAADETLSVPTPKIEQPEQVEAEAVETAADAETEELTVEDLMNMDPDKVDAGACCFAECWEEWSICVGECTNPGFLECRQACTQDRQACTSGC